MRKIAEGLFLCSFFLFLIGCMSPVSDTILDDSLGSSPAAQGKFFGTAIPYTAYTNTEHVASNRYREVAADQFNLIVPESALKMHNLWIAPETIDFTRVDALADWAVANGQKMRGHTLIWYRSVPSWLREGFRKGTYSAAEVELLVENYIEKVITHFGTNYPGLMIAWDVVNEAIGPNDPRNGPVFGLRDPGYDYTAGEDFWRLTLGDDYVEKAFRWARATDPQANLFYNDFHNEYDNPKGTAILQAVEGWLAEGIPIDGIGLQSHFSIDYLTADYPDIEFSQTAIEETLDAWVATGLEIQITELDISVNDSGQGHLAASEQVQADLYADYIEAVFSREAVTAVVTWGFTDLVSWRAENQPLYFDERIEPKAAYYSILDVLKALF